MNSTEVKDLLNIILNPAKVISTCFLCFKQNDETFSVFQKLFICDGYRFVDISLTEIMDYLFPSHDIWSKQACEDCYKLLITTYTRLRRHEYLREALSIISSNLLDEVSMIYNYNLGSSINIPLKISVLTYNYKKYVSNDKVDKEKQNLEKVSHFCKKCHIKFTNKGALKEHYRMVHKNVNKAVICEFCGKDCKKPSTLRVHLNCHNVKVCPYCSKSLKSHSHYQVHLKKHNTRVVRPTKRLIYYSCSTCSYESLNKNNVEAHKNKVHLQKRPYICDICNKGFYRKSNLTEHIAIHDNIKNFTCEICGDDFVSKKTLTEHIRLHTGEKPYVCEICNEQFVSSGRRLEHFKRKHMEKTNCCFLCDKKYGLKKELNAHLKKIHGYVGVSTGMHDSGLKQQFLLNEHIPD